MRKKCLSKAVLLEFGFGGRTGRAAKNMGRFGGAGVLDAPRVFHEETMRSISTIQLYIIVPLVKTSRKHTLDARDMKIPWS